jgi:hypothetical protein
MDRREAAAKPGDDKDTKPKPPRHQYALEIMDFLQTHVDPASFNPRGAYDGQSNLFLWRPRIGAGRKVRQCLDSHLSSFLISTFW